MKLVLLFVVVLAATIPSSGQQDQSNINLMGNFSDRSVAVAVTMIGVAKQRGADSVGVNDLLAALIIEDQEPDAPILFTNPAPGLLFQPGMHRSGRSRQSFLPPNVAVDVLVKLNQVLPRSGPSSAHGIPVSPALQRVLAAAQKLPAELHQSEVKVIAMKNRPPGMYQAVVPLDLLAAALEESCEATKMLQEAGITRETVFKVIRAGGDLENGGSS